jgi:hypothetical protein
MTPVKSTPAALRLFERTVATQTLSRFLNLQQTRILLKDEDDHGKVLNSWNHAALRSSGLAQSTGGGIVLILIAINFCLGATIAQKFRVGLLVWMAFGALFALIAFKIGLDDGVRSLFCNLICVQCSLQFGYLIGMLLILRPATRHRAPGSGAFHRAAERNGLVSNNGLVMDGPLRANVLAVLRRYSRIQRVSLTLTCATLTAEAHWGGLKVDQPKALTSARLRRLRS